MALYWGLEEWVGCENTYESDRSFRMSIPCGGNSSSSIPSGMRKKSIVGSAVYKGKPWKQDWEGVSADRKLLGG